VPIRRWRERQPLGVERAAVFAATNHEHLLVPRILRNALLFTNDAKRAVAVAFAYFYAPVATRRRHRQFLPDVLRNYDAHFARGQFDDVLHFFLFIPDSSTFGSGSKG
jgi:hypothetical protein